MIFTLILRSLLRRPLRSGLTLTGIAVAMTVLICIVGLGEGYQEALQRELQRSGVHLMLVPLGCPYDAAARVLKNNVLENSLPAGALAAVRQDQAVAVAAPMLMAALPRQNERRTDMWVGVDESALTLKPWWRVASGRAWFTNSDEVILGADAAALEMRAVNDKFFSPETRREFRVAGVLQRSGTSDDSVFFVALPTAQEMFGQRGRVSAIGVRLKDPVLAPAAAQRLQSVPGAQVVTMTEMMGTFLNLLGAIRTVVLAITAIAAAVGAMTVFNTMLASVVERTDEFVIMRALGASRVQVFALLLGESTVLTLAGCLTGLATAMVLGPRLEGLAKDWMPFAPGASLLKVSAGALLHCLWLAVSVGALAALYPAWRATRLSPALAAKLP